MPLPPHPQPRILLRYLVALLLFMVPLLVGGGFIIWHEQGAIERQYRGRLMQATAIVDQTLAHAEQVAQGIAPRLDAPCETQLPSLREQVAMVPDVRSVTLSRGGWIFCSSIYGVTAARASFQHFSDGALALKGGEYQHQPRTQFIYRLPVRDYSVLVAIDSYNLRNMLQLLEGELFLQVGNWRMAGDGRLHEGIPSGEGMLLTQASSHYPYQVGGRIDNARFWFHVREHARLETILVLLLGLLCGGCGFWLLGLRRTPYQELARALANGEFVAYIQPIVRGSDARVVGGEVLVRWEHPQLGVIEPDRFLSLAEDSGLIVPLTRELMRQVQAAFAPYADALPAGFRFGFNITACHCRDLALVSDCQAFLEGFGEAPITLVLELTEHAPIVPDETTEQLFAALRRLGIHIAIDDFGTGHASLAYLQQFQLDLIKIDKIFISLIARDAPESHIVDIIIDLAKRLGLALVAEGVETREQADYLMARGVEYMQGYLYARPVPLEGFWQEARLPAPAEERAA